jgi:hypothetical protein
MKAVEIEIVILLFTKINDQICIVLGLDVARANEVVHTNPQSRGSLNHANTLPLPSLTTLAQAAIKKQYLCCVME